MDFHFINHYITLFLVFPAMVLLGLYLTVRLRGIQITCLGLAFKELLKKDEKEEGDISHFEAISAVLAGNFGTGNISGMAIALATGGPGALIWMWVIAFLGSTIQLVSCVLGVKYRKKCDGEYVGGPMYYLSKGFGTIFAVLLIFAAITVGNFAQIHSMMLPLQKLGFEPLWIGIGIGGLVALVMAGGLSRMAGLASMLVPFKAALYLGAAFTILAFHYDLIQPAFFLMFESAFSPTAAAGGLLGALLTGFERGIFATDAGTGIVPVLQSSSRTSSPILDGIVTLVAPFLVMIVCTVTGLVLIVTGAYQVEGLQSTNMVTYAFEKGLGTSIGGYIVIVALVLFGYTTILAWGVAVEKAALFLNQRLRKSLKTIYILLIPIGAILHVDLVWGLADLCISSMLLINLIGIATLSEEVIVDYRKLKLSKVPAAIS